jgi:hypothetical protein
MFKHIFIMEVDEFVEDSQVSKMCGSLEEPRHDSAAIMQDDSWECDDSRSRALVRSNSSWSRHPLRPAHSLDAVTLRLAFPAPEIEPENFGIVREGSIYRSDFPNAANYPFLEKIGIKTILTLVDGPYPQDYVDWISKTNIRHIKYVLPPNKGKVAVKDRDIALMLMTVLEASNYPLLIHCNKGKHRTGCVVACYRRYHGESLENAIEEYRRHAGVKARPFDEKLITQFDPSHVEWETLMDELTTSIPSPTPIIRPQSVPT